MCMKNKILFITFEVLLVSIINNIYRNHYKYFINSVISGFAHDRNSLFIIFFSTTRKLMILSPANNNNSIDHGNEDKRYFYSSDFTNLIPLLFFDLFASIIFECNERFWWCSVKYFVHKHVFNIYYYWLCCSVARKCLEKNISGQNKKYTSLLNKTHFVD